MVTKPPRRNRRVNVAVPFDLRRFLFELARATNWEGAVPDTIRGGPLDEERSTVDSPGQFSVSYLFSELLSKYDDGKPSPEKAETTWQRFSEAERMCSLTNQRLIYDKSRHSIRTDSVWSIIEMARRKIVSCIGRFRWDDAAQGFGFGPGASFSLPRTKADLVYKYSGTPETTYGNAGLAEACISASPLWKECVSSDLGLQLKIVGGNRVVTVPKSYKTDRVIAIEPRMNMYVQKGIGRVLRSRLKRVGIDLDDQSMNQDLASLDVAFGLATVDLSMASDTVSHELVRVLLPPDWVEALELCRSPVGTLPSGETILYRKFSSMGNGYTFELESLIFWALSSSVVETCGIDGSLTWVYGDDIIVPTDAVPLLLDVLQFCGFQPNRKKTHADGHFRESCGKHFFYGLEVTPFFIRSDVKTLRDLFLLHNQLYRWCLRNQWNDTWSRPLMRQLLSRLRALAPNQWRKARIPDGYGDGAFIGTFDDCLPTRRYFLEGYQVEVLADVMSTNDLETMGRYIKSLVLSEQRQPIVDVTCSLGGRRVTVQLLPELRGGASKPPRSKIVKIFVRQYSILDPFEDFSVN